MQKTKEPDQSENNVRIGILIIANHISNIKFFCPDHAAGSQLHQV